MNINTGQLYPTREDALKALAPDENEKDVVEIIGTPEAVEQVARSVAQVAALEKRRAANKAARATRRQQRSKR